MNIFEDVKLNTMQFIGPLIVLILTTFALAVLYRILFGWLPKEIYNSLLGIIAFVGLYIWAFPFNMGFYEFFK